MKRMAVIAAALMLVFAAHKAVADDVLYSFELDVGGGNFIPTNDGWFSFGNGTTDAGADVPGSQSTHSSRFHTAAWSEVSPAMTFGVGDASPTGIDLTAYQGFSMDLKFDVPGDLPSPQVAFDGVAEVRMMIAIGYAEWSTTVVPTDTFNTFAVDFVALTPNYYASIAPYNGNLPALDDAGLKFQLIMPRVPASTGVANTGTGSLMIDQVTGIVPEPTTFALVSLTSLAIVSRRRQRRIELNRIH